MCHIEAYKMSEIYIQNKTKQSMKLKLSYSIKLTENLKKKCYLNILILQISLRRHAVVIGGTPLRAFRRDSPSCTHKI